MTKNCHARKCVQNNSLRCEEKIQERLPKLLTMDFETKQVSSSADKLKISILDDLFVHSGASEHVVCQ